jgi:cell division protein FtsW
VAVFSASWVKGFDLTGDAQYFFKRQVVYGIMGIAAMVTLSNVDYRFWRKTSGLMLVLTILLLLSVFVLSKGKINGAHRWITIGPIQSFQPSELAKLTLIIYLAGWLSQREKVIGDIAGTFIPFTIILSAIAFLMLREPDFGTLIIMVVIAVTMYFVAGMTWKQIILGVVVLGLAGGAIAIASPYRLNRILTFLDPQQDTSGISYHVNNITIAVGSGGLTGLGFGESRQKRNFLPEPHTDSIFAVITEELGSLRSVLLIFVFAYLVIRGFRIAMYAEDMFGKLLATGITTWFAFQAGMNLGAVLHLLPLVGIPLPFISYGGTSLLICLTAAGILLNVSRYQVAPKTTPINRRGSVPARRGNHL